MIRIALCEDDVTELAKADFLLQQYQQLHQEYDMCLCRFTSMEQLFIELEQGTPFHLLLLDIYLPGISGVDGYRQLLQQGIELPVIFLTTSKDHALSAFQLNAVQYLLKPIPKEAFFSAMDKVFLTLKEDRRRHLVVSVQHELRRIRLRDLVYCESQNNYQLFHLTDGTSFSVKMTMCKLCDILSEFDDFVRVGSSYMINLSHIHGIKTKELHMDDGSLIWIPRGAYPQLKERYLSFFCDRSEELC